MEKIKEIFEPVEMILYIRIIIMNFCPVLFFLALLFLELDTVTIVFEIIIISILVFNFVVLRKKVRNLKIMKKAIYSNVDEFQTELEFPVYINYREYILTEKYIIDLRDYKIIKYDDIRIMYYCKKRSLISKDIPLVLTLMTNQEKLSLRVCSIYHLGRYYEDLEKLVKSKNSNVKKCKKKDLLKNNVIEKK